MAVASAEPGLPLRLLVAPLAGGVCDQAALDASNDTVPAKIRPVAMRMACSLLIALRAPAMPRPGRFAPNRSYPSRSGDANAMNVASACPKSSSDQLIPGIIAISQAAANARAIPVLMRVSSGATDSAKTSAM
ncbi:hypothetical protein BE61_60970 [Bradyrhizobium elkanii USDA 61]|nr:hypothetical protein BE61_60970 [Bradyrhizobium elkanii USDA 61]